MTDGLLRRRAHADMDLLGAKSQDGFGPGMSPVRIRHQLRLVDDGDVIILIEIRHLNGGGRHPASLLLDALLPRPHGAGHAHLIHALIDLQGQKPQGPQVHAAGRLLQPLQGLEGLPAVRGPDMQDEMPPQLPHLRELHLGSRRHQLQNLIFHLIAAELRIKSKQCLRTDGPRHGAPQPRQELAVHALPLILQQKSQIEGRKLRDHLCIDLLDQLRPVPPVGVGRHILQLPVQILQHLAVRLVGTGAAEGLLQILHPGLGDGILQGVLRLFPSGLFIFFYIKLIQLFLLNHGIFLFFPR